MPRQHFLDELEEKKTRAEDIAQSVIHNPNLVLELLEGFLSDAARVKFKSARVLVLIGMEKPDPVYPHFDFFAEQLQSENRILRWNTVDMIAHLAHVDSEGKFDRLVEKYYGLLQGVTPCPAFSARSYRVRYVLFGWTDFVQKNLTAFTRQRYLTSALLQP